MLMIIDFSAVFFMFMFSSIIVGIIYVAVKGIKNYFKIKEDKNEVNNYFNDEESREKERIRIENRKKEYWERKEKEKNENIEKYGEEPIIIKISPASSVYFLMKSGIIIINNQTIKFNDIIDASFVNTYSEQKTSCPSSVVKTSTSSLVTRTIVGGLIAGPAGAIVGASTAKKTITSPAPSQTCNDMNYPKDYKIMIADTRNPQIILKYPANIDKLDEMFKIILHKR